MLNFEQHQNGVFEQLKEDKIDPRLWGLSEIKNALNDSYWYIADATHCFRLKAIIEIMAGIRIYKLPSNYITGSLDRVEFNKKRIYPITSDELDAINRSWRNVTSSNITNYFPPNDICLSDEIAVYPKPDTDGSVYNLASESKNHGVITTIGDDSYEEFTSEEGVITTRDGEETGFDETEGSGPVMEIKDPTNNLTIFAAKYPKRLYRDEEVFLHPVNNNPRRVLYLGALAVLLTKEGEGKDIAKASYYNKRFVETLSEVFGKSEIKRTHRIRSISEISIGYNSLNYGRLNLGENYPAYYMK